MPVAKDQISDVRGRIWTHSRENVRNRDGNPPRHPTVVSVPSLDVSRPSVLSRNGLIVARDRIALARVLPLEASAVDRSRARRGDVPMRRFPRRLRAGATCAPSPDRPSQSCNGSRNAENPGVATRRRIQSRRLGAARPLARILDRSRILRRRVNRPGQLSVRRKSKPRGRRRAVADRTRNRRPGAGRKMAPDASASIAVSR